MQESPVIPMLDIKPHRLFTFQPLLVRLHLGLLKTSHHGNLPMPPVSYGKSGINRIVFCWGDANG